MSAQTVRLDWKLTSNELPPEKVVVMTKIDDAKGCRNEQRLQLINNLWFFEDGSMYAYYNPTHWAYIQ